jgi:DNA repair exonuclease SbcCD ATPase subunit
MKQMAQEMANMQQKMSEEEAEEDIAALRAILENLLQLSFDQEELMKSFKNINQTDPLYVQLSQSQLKLKDDAKLIEDSLFALSKRVIKIKPFITKEVGLMNDYLDESVKAIKQRKADVASGKQQFAMTSINNLALMLSNVLKQMQDQAANAKEGNGMCNKPGKKPGGKGKGKKPSLGELQKHLNAQMQQLGKKGKSGQQMSEELAKMAARQEMIRNALKELENEMGQDGKKAGSNLGKLAEKMEKTEEDIINRQITQQTIERQQEILTRLLEAEKSVRERETEERRESEVAKQQNVSIPPSFSKYLKQKEKQIELLKTVPPNFTQYFKQEVGDYFKKIEK